MRCGRDKPLVKSQLRMASKMLGAVSEEPDIVNCESGGVDVFKTLDQMPSGKNGLQYLFSIQALQVEKLLRKPS